MKTILKSIRNKVIYENLVEFRISSKFNPNTAPFLITSTGSSGSHLLGILLDSHSTIAVGPELNVFNKIEMYGPFSTVKMNIEQWLRTSLPSYGYSKGSRFFDASNSYYWDPKLLPILAQKCKNSRDFFDQFFHYFLKKRKKKIWGEKTPSNVYLVPQFLEMYPKGKIIHLIRDPRDAITSFVKRGLDIEYASKVWLTRTAAIVPLFDNPLVLPIHYETLVTDVDATIGKILNHLSLPFEPLDQQRSENDYWKKILTHQYHNAIHSSWNRNPLFSPISTESIGNYQEFFQEADLSFIRKVSMDFPDSTNFSISDFMDSLGYS